MANPDSVTVRKVETQADFKAFFEFPWKLYRDDPNWVPPLLSMRRHLLDKNENPSWEYLEGDYYVAWRAGEPVGTVAAFVNHRHNEFHNEHISWFGFFECIDDQDVATALLDTAAAWGRERGYNALRGPQSFTNMDECGLLVDGFARPVMLMPYNPPYYQRLVENAGLAKVMDTHSAMANWDILHEAGAVDRVNRIADRIKRSQSITVRGLDRKNLKAEFELFKDIYNHAWEKNWGFTPFTSKELDALVKSLGSFIDPELACFGYVGGEPAGFLLCVPDFGQVLHRAYAKPGTPEFVTLIKALWHWRIRPKINWIRVPLMGVVEGQRGKGVDLAMYAYIMDAVGRTRYDHVDGGWVLETNRAMLGLVNQFKMNIYRTYRFYEKPLQG